jgi:hypothetical protein
MVGRGKNVLEEANCEDGQDQKQGDCSGCLSLVSAWMEVLTGQRGSYVLHPDPAPRYSYGQVLTQFGADTAARRRWPELFEMCIHAVLGSQTLA